MRYRLLSPLPTLTNTRTQSASLRSVYSDQLREREVVPGALMIHMPDILRQACSGIKPSDSVYFAVDEFHLEGQCFDELLHLRLLG